MAYTSFCFQGFRGTHHPPALPSHGIEDNAPDPICLLAMMKREDLHLLKLVRFHFNGYAFHIICICLVYEMYIHLYIICNGNGRTCILRVYTPYSISCIANWSFLCFTWLGSRHMAYFFCFQFSKKSDFFSFSGFRGTHRPPAPRIFICVIRWGSTTMDDAFDILCICCVYTIHILTELFWYTNYNILICDVYVAYILYIYWLNYFDILTKIFWYVMYMLRIYYTYTDNFFCQGHDSAPVLDIMLLKQQHLSVSGS
jgi:hypothetical protein